MFIEGPSGSGKSTLLSLIGAVLGEFQGNINVLGQDVARLGAQSKDQFRADNIGFIFQMFNLIPYLSMVENVILPCQFSTKRRKAALKGIDSIDEQAQRLLDHLGLSKRELESNKVMALSVGQQQRVAAARALIGNPGLVIADEPTSSLDADTREKFIRLLFEECDTSGSTLVFVSHDRSLGSLFSRRVVLNDINHAAGDLHLKN